MKQKTLRSILAFLTVLLMCACVFLAGCDADKPEEDSTAAAENVEAESKESVPETAALAETERSTAEETERSTAEETEAEEPLITDEVLQNHIITSENYPVMDGSTSTVPLGKEIAKYFLEIDDAKAENICQFHKTTKSFWNLIKGECDILVVGEPKESVFREIERDNYECEMEVFATDALVFIVNENNPVDDLTTEQIRDIYSGKITNWKDVGGMDAPIVAFQRNEGAGSQALIKKLVMGDAEMAVPPATRVVDAMGELMTAVRNYDNSANAIGYSVYYYANDMKMADGLKILKVDGVAPENETIRKREYPHLNAYYCVIPAKPRAKNEQSVQKFISAKVIYDWLVSDEGQKLVASLGYVSVRDPENDVEEIIREKNLYSTIDGKSIGEIGNIKERNDYGVLIPFIGDSSKSFELTCYKYGFMDGNGRIVSDAIYSDISRLTNGTDLLPMYAAKEGEDEGEGEEEAKYWLVKLDGSFVSGNAYDYLIGSENGVFCRKGKKSFDYISTNGFLMFTEKELIQGTDSASFREKLENVEHLEIRFGGGYYIVSVDEENYLLDTDFHVLAGPYRGMSVSSEGVVKIWQEEENLDNIFTVIGDLNILDNNYQLMFEKGYDHILVLDNGNFVTCDEEKKEAILFDRDGNTLRNFEGVLNEGYRFGPVWYAYCGFMLNRNDPVDQQIYTYYYTESGDLVRRMHFGSTRLVTENLTVLSGNMSGGTFCRLQNASGVMLYRTGSDLSRYIKYCSVSECFTDSEMPDSGLIVAQIANNGPKILLMDMNLETMAELSGTCEQKTDDVTGKGYLLIRDQNNQQNGMFLLDQTGTVVAEDLNGRVYICGGWILTTTDRETEGRKIGSEQVFRYQLNGIGDD